MHPNKIVMTKSVDEDVGDQWHPASTEVEGEVIARYIRANRAYKRELELVHHERGKPPSLIWLEPTCRDCIQADRLWCEQDAWDYCLQCGHKSIPYIRDIDEEEKLK